ncbi:MAG: flippase-like domain-containing protein [Candidatus Latescibacteria bacterium]|jgi:glycosyltransferase 2 family protein|nr:flippase-like domain-containing protein [Candidatus Latescibacterota bacterium]
MGRWILGVLVGIGAGYYTLRSVSVGDVTDSLSEVSLLHIAGTFLVMCSAYYFRLHRWKILLYPMKQVPLSGLISPLAIGLMGNILPGRTGELLKGFLLSRKHNVPFTGGMATVVAERLCDLTVILLLCFWVFRFALPADLVSDVYPELPLRDVLLRFSEFGLAAAVILVLLVVLSTTQRAASLRIVNSLGRFLPTRWVDITNDAVGHVAEGFGAFAKPRDVLLIVMDSLLLWGITIVSFAPLYWAFDLQEKTLVSLIVVRVMISVFITVLPTPAFLGSFSAGAIVALRDVMGEGVVAAAGFGVLVWALNTLLVFGAGLLMVILEGSPFRDLWWRSTQSEASRQSTTGEMAE